MAEYCALPSHCGEGAFFCPFARIQETLSCVTSSQAAKMLEPGCRLPPVQDTADHVLYNCHSRRAGSRLLGMPFLTQVSRGTILATLPHAQSIMGKEHNGF